MTAPSRSVPLLPAARSRVGDGLTCLETAHERLENYATDPQTQKLLDNVEVFIPPNSNPDGAATRTTTSTSSATMTNTSPPTGTHDRAARNSGAST